MQPVFYYTFLDSNMDYYTSININFIELTHLYTYFVLISGEKDGKPYSEYLKTILGPKTIYIESAKNSMVVKFNLFRKYLLNNPQYNDSIFCKIDTDLVHYNSKSFHSYIRSKFSKNKNLFMGNGSVGTNETIRGGLNAIHCSSILACGDLPEDHHPYEFDMLFSRTLFAKGVKKHIVTFFAQSYDLSHDACATHVVHQRLNDKKNEEVSHLLFQLKNSNLPI